MMIDSDLLRKKLRQRMNDKADHVAGGACNDFAEYKNAVGVIEGLAMAERDLLDMAEDQMKREQGEDDE